MSTQIAGKYRQFKVYVRQHQGGPQGTLFGATGFVHHINDQGTTCGHSIYVDKRTMWESCSYSGVDKSIQSSGRGSGTMDLTTATNLALIIIIIQVSSAVVAARLREQPAPTTDYTASLELFCVIYAIQFCLMQFGAASPCQPWSLGTCRSAAGRCHASWGGWFWVGRDVFEVLPFRNMLTLPGLPALSRPNVGCDQIATIAFPSRHSHRSYKFELVILCGHFIPMRRLSCFRWKAFSLSVSDPVRPHIPALYRSTGRTNALYKRNRSRSLTCCLRNQRTT